MIVAEMRRARRSQCQALAAAQWLRAEFALNLWRGHAYGDGVGAGGILGAGFASEDCLFRELENGAAIFVDHFDPGHASHHWKIDAAEKHAGDENVEAKAEGLVVERIDGLGDGFGAVGLRPAVSHFVMSFFDTHL